MPSETAPPSPEPPPADPGAFQDRTLACADCGAAFVHTAKAQAEYLSRGFQHEPKRCLTCRQARKVSRRERRAGPEVAEPAPAPAAAASVGQALPPAAAAEGGRPTARSAPSASTSARQTAPSSAKATGGRQTAPAASTSTRPAAPPPRALPAPPPTVNIRPLARGGRESGEHEAPLRPQPVACARCGKTGTVPFQPQPDRPVFCRSCFEEWRRGAAHPAAATEAADEAAPGEAAADDAE